MEEPTPFKNNSTPLKFLIIGIVMTCLGFSLLPALLTFKSSLVPVIGTLRNANTYNETVYRKGQESRRSELIFYLKEKDQQYYLAENIGDLYINEKYEEILRGLKRSNRITVWIKKNAVSQFKPDVFQIDTDTTTLLDHETVRTNNAGVTFLLLILGPGLIFIFLALKFSGKFVRVARENDKD